MTEKRVSADWREEFFNKISNLEGPNFVEQLVALNLAVEDAKACDTLTEADGDEVQARIQERLDQIHAARSAHQSAKPVVEEAAEVLAEVEDGAHLYPAKTKPGRTHEPLPPEILQDRRRRWDHQSFLWKVARIPAKFFIRFRHGTGSVLAVIIRDIIKLGSCTRSYASFMKEAGVCRATVAEAMTLIRQLSLFDIKRRRRNSNLITTKPGEIHNYIFKLPNKTQLTDRKEKKDSLYSLGQQTLKKSAPTGALPAAVQQDPLPVGPKQTETAPEPSSAQETAKPVISPVERPTVPGFDEHVAKVLRGLGMDPDRRGGGPVPQPG